LKEDLPRREEDLLRRQGDLPWPEEDLPRRKEDLFRRPEDLPRSEEDLPRRKGDLPQRKEDLLPRQLDPPRRQRDLPEYEGDLLRRKGSQDKSPSFDKERRRQRDDSRDTWDTQEEPRDPIMYPRSGGASSSKDYVHRPRGDAAKRSPGGMDLEDQVEVLAEANGAPRVQIEYESWLQLKEYLEAIYKQKQENEGKEEAEPKAKKAKPGIN